MNFRIKVKKINWTLIVSILGSILSTYMVSSDIFYRTKVEELSGGVLGSLSPLSSGILYLLLLFVVMFVLWFVVVYVVWSFFEQ
jgi:hypothetical protein